LRERLEATLNLCDLRRSASERLIGNLSKGYRQRVGIAEALLDEPKLLILDEPTIGLDPRQTGIVRRLLERLRGETSFLLSSHVLSEVEASCDRMLILNRGRIVAEGTLQELQAEYLDNTVFEVVAGGERSVIEKIAKDIDPLCELTDESPTDATGRKRFSFSTPQGESSAESILKALVAQSVTQTREFTMARPDLESIFLKATKRSWEQTDSSRENVREVSATLQPDEEEEEGAK
jgi:ABC-2 type transport system ATP-binding protein